MRKRIIIAIFVIGAAAAVSKADSLHWNSSPGAVKYNIYGDGKKLDTVFASNTSWQIPTKYNLYTVTAVNSSGIESGNSNAVIGGQLTIY